MISRSSHTRITFFDLWSRLSSGERDLVATYSGGDGWEQSIAWNHAASASLPLEETEKIKQFVATNHEKNARVYAMVPYSGACVLYASARYVSFSDGAMVLHAQSDEDLARFEQEVAAIMNRKSTDEQATIHSWQYPDNTAYAKAFEIVHEKIRAGYIYQMNLTHKLRAKSDASPVALFRYVVERTTPRFGGVFQYGDTALISGSPEEFVRIEGGVIRTQPIKGTRPRGETKDADEAQKNELLNSPKEKAELAMIVDLLRNDVGKVCTIGSVKVERVREIRALSGVFHAYATITGRLAVSPIEALLSMLPGGSISGVPKHEALGIIADVEQTPRGPYTGVFGYIDPNETAHFSILIRTLEQRGEDIELGVGGGIVFDSSAENEYAETIAKAQPFIRRELVSERLEREFGALAFAVLRQDNNERISALYRKADMMPLSYHIVRFGPAVAQVPELHKAILQGAKIGASFKAAGVPCEIIYHPRAQMSLPQEAQILFNTSAAEAACERIEYRIQGECYALILDYYNPNCPGV